MFDPFGHRIKHETRFDYDKIPAVVDIPEYPSCEEPVLSECLERK